MEEKGPLHRLQLGSMSDEEEISVCLRIGASPSRVAPIWYFLLFELVRELLHNPLREQIGEHEHVHMAFVIGIHVGCPVLLQP